MIVDQLKTLFQKHGIGQVAIIDDAYLEHPTVADLRAVDGLTTLWAGIEASDETLEFLKARGISLVAPEDIDEVRLKRLYELRGQHPGVHAVLSQFDEIQTHKREQLDALKALLAELGLIPLELAPLTPLNPDILPDLIFLDYYLDPAGLESSLPVAQSIGENLQNTFVQRPKPYVVLMSNVSDIKPENRSLFRDTAKIMGGMFHFIPKADLQDRNTLVLKLALMVRSIEEGRKIQQFMERYDGAIHEIAAAFQKKIRGLSIEDYAYIQKMSLQGEGQPLGDYVLWLFGMYFSHLLERSNPEGRKVIDAMVFSHIPAALATPSPDFVGLYQNVVSESVDDLGTHPRLPESELARLGDNAPPDPHFGDLFFRDDGTVQMIATAECDLMYAPEPESGRPFVPDQPVVLIPGKLEQHSAPVSDETPCTEFVEIEGKNHRISWKVKKFRTIPAGELRTLKQSGFQRRRRLRMPFCHEVQQTLTRDIERIGVPVSPPMVRSAGLDVYFRAAEAGYRRVPGPKDGVTVSYVIRGGVETIQFRLGAVVAVVAECANAKTELQRLVESDPRKRPGYERDIGAITAFLESIESQLGLTESFSLKILEEYQVRNAPIKVLRQITEDQLRNWRPRQPIIVVVVEEPAPDREPAGEMDAVVGS